MSYNLLSGSIEFIGDQLGEIENIVNTHSNQTISGDKTFAGLTTCTAGAIITGGAVQIATALRHYGDSDTDLSFTPDTISLNAAGNTLLIADASSAQKIVAVNHSQIDVDFKIFGGQADQGILYDSSMASLSIGDITTPPPDNSVLTHISSSYNIGSLLSVGNRKHPVLAVSGGVDRSDWKVVISGAIKAEGPLTTTAGITASTLTGELINIGNGLQNSLIDSAQRVNVKPAAGISTSAAGVKLDVDSLNTIGSINTSLITPDYFSVHDHDQGETRKMAVGAFLNLTVDSADGGLNLGGGSQLYQTTSSRRLNFRSLTAGTGITLTQTATEIEVASTSTAAISYYNNPAQHRVLVGGTATDVAVGSTNLSFNGDRLSITGSLASSAAVYNAVTTQGASYTLGGTDRVVLMNTPFESSLTASLPVALSAPGIVYTIKNIGTGELLISPDAAETIDGSSNLSLISQGQSRTIIADGDVWTILSSHD